MAAKKGLGGGGGGWGGFWNRAVMNTPAEAECAEINSRWFISGGVMVASWVPQEVWDISSTAFTLERRLVCAESSACVPLDALVLYAFTCRLWLGHFRLYSQTALLYLNRWCVGPTRCRRDVTYIFIERWPLQPVLIPIYTDTTGSVTSRKSHLIS